MEKLMDLYNVRDFLVYYTACLFKESVRIITIWES